MKDGALVVRLLTASDAPAMARVHALSFRKGWSAKDFAGWLSQTQGVFAAGAQLKDVLIGFGLCLPANDGVDLATIAVDPNWRNKGVGADLVTALISEAMIRGANAMTLEVAVDNHPAIALYKTAGFKTVGGRPGYYARPDGPRVDADVLSKSLTPADAPTPRTAGASNGVLGPSE